MEVRTIINNRTVDVYDGPASLAEAFRRNGSGVVTLYTKGNSAVTVGGGVTIRPYRALLEAADCSAGVCVLNDNAVKVLIAMYPSAPRYVLLRLRFHSAWLLGILGLIRRLLFGLVRVKGVVTIIDQKLGRTKWLVIEQRGMKARAIPVLPKAIGISAFLEWLNSEKLNYVVLRFYEKLPELYREGGDLDLLLTIEDKKRVEEYLEKNKHLLSNDTDDIRLGLHAVSGEPGIVPYYPPPLALQILENAVPGPAGSRIPSPRDAFLSFIYHALYHAKKGYVSGIPSVNKEKTDKFPENDYTGIIRKMAREQSVPLSENFTMEELDDYMAEVGWRPKLDTLAKIGETNAWVRDRFFAAGQGGPVGLAVFMLREWAYEKGHVEEMIKIIKQNGFEVLREKILSSEEKQSATLHLRGGTWGENPDGTTTGWLPAVAIVVVDKQSAKLPPSYATGYERFRIRNLKNVLRTTFDTDDRGSVHSTDTARESWEYIEVCFKDEVEAIRSEFKALAQGSLFAKLANFFSLTYIKHSFRYSFREWLIQKFLN